jgi:hypothetical protein
MKKILLILIIFSFPFIGNIQVNGACTWTGADNANNTNWTNSGTITINGTVNID